MTMANVALLGILAVLLLGPASNRLARARWVYATPRAAVALWQALGVGALVSGIGAGLLLAVERYHSGFVNGVIALAHGLVGRHPLLHLGLPDALGLTLAADLLIVLSAVIAVTMTRIIRVRARHRTLVDLLARPSDPLQVEVLRDPRAVAYCLPGRPPKIIISEGAIERLSQEQMACVIEHERGHARAHHGLVLLPHVAVRHVFGWIPYGRLAVPAISELLEMAADDYAAKRHDPLALASALVQMSVLTTSPHGSLAAATNCVPVRIERLRGLRRRSPSLGVLAALLAVCSVLIPFVVLLTA
jgi:Zn-dependent protease with chaperone function